jgi:hypothetical protein
LTPEPLTAAEFKRLHDETGWGGRPLAQVESALAGTWIVCTDRNDAGTAVGIGCRSSDGRCSPS